MSTRLASEVKSVFDFFVDPVPPITAEPANEIDDLYALCDDPMTTPVKLVDEKLRFTDLSQLKDYFVENSGFLVIGVIGLQGSGKSSVLNIMANRLDSQAGPFCGPFPVESTQSLINNQPATVGVDMYITQDRVILLDTQPLLSWPLMDIYFQTSGDTGGSKLEEVVRGDRLVSLCPPSGKWSLDQFCEMASIQIISFLFSVCHVVIAVQDNLSNTELLRLIDKAASLKPLIHVEDVLLSPHISGYRAFRPSRSVKPFPSNIPISDFPNDAVSVRGNVINATAKPFWKEQQPSVDRNAVPDYDEDTEADKGVPGSDETGLGQTPSTVRLPAPSTGLDAQRHSRQCLVDEVAEQAEVRSFVNRLQSVTDYSASLINVYNCAPPSIFLNDNVQLRLSDYKRLLKYSFPNRARFASLAKLGPRILRRHMKNKCRAQYDQAYVQPAVKESVADTVGASEHVPRDISDKSLECSTDAGLRRTKLERDVLRKLDNLELYSKDNGTNSQTASGVLCLANETSAQLSAPNAATASSPDQIPSAEQHPAVESDTTKLLRFGRTQKSACVSEEELISECCHLLAAESAMSPKILTATPTPTGDDGDEDDEDEEDYDVADDDERLEDRDFADDGVIRRKTEFPNRGRPSTMENFFEDDGGGYGDGEQKAVELNALTRRVANLRRHHYDLSKQLKRPRFFVLPTTNEKGQVTYGCPTYMQCAHRLQEAVLSTYRQHMLPNFTEYLWLEYSQKMWEKISMSPLLTDYHRLLLNNT